jgi:ubiquinone/menaquinone biosynthesis C-methylase UbiE
MQASEKNRSHNLLKRFMRLFFFLLYHPFAWSYDLVAAVVSAGRWNIWIRSSASFVRGQHILELGHGPGHLQAHLMDQNRFVFGIDRSRQMGRIAYRRLYRLGVQPQLTRASALRLPFSDDSFDTAIATFPTEFIAQPETLVEIRRVLGANGRLVVLLSAWITGGGLFDRFLAKLFDITGQSQPIADAGNQALDFLQKAGFNPKLEWVEMQDSKLLVLIGDIQ